MLVPNTTGANRTTDRCTHRHDNQVFAGSGGQQTVCMYEIDSATSLLHVLCSLNRIMGVWLTVNECTSTAEGLPLHGKDLPAHSPWMLTRRHLGDCQLVLDWILPSMAVHVVTHTQPCQHCTRTLAPDTLTSCNQPAVAPPSHTYMLKRCELGTHQDALHRTGLQPLSFCNTLPPNRRLLRFPTN